MNCSINLKVMTNLETQSINGSHEEISSVHEDSFKTNLLSFVRSHQSDKILLLPPRSAL